VARSRKAPVGNPPPTPSIGLSAADRGALGGLSGGRSSVIVSSETARFRRPNGQMDRLESTHSLHCRDSAYHRIFINFRRSEQGSTTTERVRASLFFGRLDREQSCARSTTSVHT
jgi:hypothetical protein